MTPAPENTCKNCSNIFTDNFCNHCGQREAHRLSVSHVLHNLFHVFLHADKALFPFMARVVFYPGIIAREYIDGKRKIFNPFQYLLFGVAILVFIMNQLNFYDDLGSMNQDAAKGLPAQYKEGMDEFNTFMQNKVNILTLITLPIFALFSYIFLQKYRRNYAEHVTLMVFSFCQIFTLNIVVMMAAFIFKVDAMEHVMISVLLMVLGFIITFRQFFKLKILTATLKAIIVFAIAYIVQATISLFAMVLYILIFKRQ